MRHAYTNELSPREQEIIETIVKKQCFSIEKISKILNIQKSTVSCHLNNIYIKKLLPYNSIAALVWDYYNKEGVKNNDL